MKTTIFLVAAMVAYSTLALADATKWSCGIRSALGNDKNKDLVPPIALPIKVGADGTPTAYVKFPAFIMGSDKNHKIEASGFLFGASRQLVVRNNGQMQSATGYDASSVVLSSTSEDGVDFNFSCELK